MNHIRPFPPHNLDIFNEKSFISLRNAISTCHCAKTILFYYYSVIPNSCTNNLDCTNKRWCRSYLITRWRENDFLTFHRCWIRFKMWNIFFLPASVVSVMYPASDSGWLPLKSHRKRGGQNTGSDCESSCCSKGFFTDIWKTWLPVNFSTIWLCKEFL